MKYDLSKKWNNKYSLLSALVVASIIWYTTYPNTAEEIPYHPYFEEWSHLPYCGNLSEAAPQRDVVNFLEEVKQEFYNCINPIVQQWDGRPQEMSLEWVEKAKICDRLPIFEDLKAHPFVNGDEVKFAVLPKCKEENVMITMGIGHDTLAERKLNKTLPNTKFYGADPIIDPNMKLYTEFGKFFPFAMGRNPGISRFFVLPKERRYTWQDVTTIPFLYYLHDILKLKKIDIAWIDIEGGEFEFLDQIHEDVQFCQFHMEFHSKFVAAGAQIFYDFIHRILKDQKYVFYKSMWTTAGVHRTFFVNVKDKECVAKFFNNY